MTNKIWLVGSGVMAQSYATVIKDIGVEFDVIGRGDASAARFHEATGVPVQAGGLDRFLAQTPVIADAAIVSVGVEALAATTKSLLEAGVKRILVEKPGALHLRELQELRDLAASRHATVEIGYNRRFYASTLALQQLAAEDGGIVSCQFEFTEWGHEIEGLQKAQGVKERWLLSNSSHVIDLAFHLIGLPGSVHCVAMGSLPWHESAAAFAGSGVSKRDIPFAYYANWDAPGRWGVEVLTRQRRFILRPMESLQVMRRGSVAIEPVAIDDAIDRAFKPGLHRQVAAFLQGAPSALCSLQAQIDAWDVYCRMGNYQP